MFSFLAAIISLATLIDVYKVAKEWYINTIKSHDEISALINENRQNQIDIHKTEHSILELNDYSRKIVKIIIFHFNLIGQPLGLRILGSFSLYTNTVKLFKITKSDDHLECINALRFLSISWYF